MKMSENRYKFTRNLSSTILISDTNKWLHVQSSWLAKIWDGCDSEVPAHI